MIPKYEDLDHINSISAQLAARFAVLYDKIVALEIENEHLRNELTERIHMCDMRSEKILELTDERDEARRMWCEAEDMGNRLSVDDMKRRARAEAKRRGWDCFGERK